MHCCQSQNPRGVFHLLPPRNFSKFLDKSLSTSGSACVKRIENRCPVGHFKVILYGKFCSRHQARTLQPPRRVGDSLSQYLNIFLQLCERLAFRDVVVNAPTNFRISTVSALFIHPASSFSVLCAKTVAVLYLCRFLTMQAFAPIIHGFGGTYFNSA